MDFRTMPASFAAMIGALTLKWSVPSQTPHIVDQLIAERTQNLSANPLWPVMRPLFYRFLHYSEAIRMADEIAPMPAWTAFEYLSELLKIDLHATGLENIPASGGFILAPTHPTGIADGIAIFDLLRPIRRDIAIFANRDALRVTPRFGEIIIPVEWRPGEKSHAKSRDTLERTALAFREERAVVLFASGRIAYWNEGKLTERPWQNSLVALARRYEVPIVPVNLKARNSPLFYLMSRMGSELRDMTVFRELLNKKGMSFNMIVGKPIAPDRLAGDAAALTQRLQQHTVERLAADPQAEFI